MEFELVSTISMDAPFLFLFCVADDGVADQDLWEHLSLLIHYYSYHTVLPTYPTFLGFDFLSLWGKLQIKYCELPLFTKKQRSSSFIPHRQIFFIYKQSKRKKKNYATSRGNILCIFYILWLFFSSSSFNYQLYPLILVLCTTIDYWSQTTL